MSLLAQLCVLLTAGLFAHWLRFGSFSLENSYLIAILVGLLSASVILPSTGAFRKELKWATARRIRRLLAGWSLVVVVLVVVSALFKNTAEFSRIWFGYWVALGVAGLIFNQIVEWWWKTRVNFREGQQRKLVLVGAGEAAQRIERIVTEDRANTFKLVERFGEGWGSGATLAISKLSDYVAKHKIEDVWIAAPLNKHWLIESALAELQESLVDVHVIPDFEQYRMLNQGISEWNGIPIINLSGIPMAGDELALKRWMDRVGSFILLVVLSPLMAVISLLILATSHGSILFKQKRLGFGGEVIEVFKFRTMREHFETEGTVTQAQKGDVRITGIGRVLRAFSLDELPQLVNILKGEMSLVGPRPHALEHNDFYMARIPKYMLRHKVTPGMTGWAQVNGYRGITDTDEKMLLRIEHDLWYIQNWTLWLDIQILFRTPMAMFGKGVF